MKIKIGKIYHNDRNRKTGEKYVNRNGKEYIRCTIVDEAGVFYSGFGNQTTNSWKIGDDVEVEVTKNGNFNNFEIKPNKITQKDIENLEARIEALEIMVEIVTKKVNEL